MGKRARKYFDQRFAQGFEISYAAEAVHVSEQNYRNTALDKAIRVVFKELLGRDEIEEELYGNTELVVRKRNSPRTP